MRLLHRTLPPFPGSNIMPQLNAQQLEERKIVLKAFFESFRRERPWLNTMEQAKTQFILYLQSDPIILRTINGLAASTTPTKGAS